MIVATEQTGTKERIVDAARELFFENGYEATGLTQIRERAGVNSGSLYYFFHSKEDLLVAVLERYKELMWPVVMEPVFSRMTDPVERIFAVLDGYRQMLLATACTTGCPIGNLALEMSQRSEAARRLIGENFENWRGVIQRCLDEASDRFPADVDLDQLATFVLTVMEGGVMQARTHQRIDPFEASVDMLRDYFERLMEARSDAGSGTANVDRSRPVVLRHKDGGAAPQDWRTW